MRTVQRTTTIKGFIMHIRPSSFRIGTPFTALWRWLMAKPGRPGQTLNSSADFPAASCMRPLHPPTMPGDTVFTGIRTATRLPLRVLRVMDADLAPAQIGRLRISGRMADVCAELDRLAAHEVQFH
jgi:hypothetical protein